MWLVAYCRIIGDRPTLARFYTDQGGEHLTSNIFGGRRGHKARGIWLRAPSFLRDGTLRMLSTTLIVQPWRQIMLQAMWPTFGELNCERMY